MITTLGTDFEVSLATLLKKNNTEKKKGVHFPILEMLPASLPDSLSLLKHAFSVLGCCSQFHLECIILGSFHSGEAVFFPEHKTFFPLPSYFPNKQLTSLFFFFLKLFSATVEDGLA